MDKKYTIDQLRQVKGIGEKTIKRIVEQFDESEYVSKYDPSIHIEPNTLVQGDMLELMNGIPDNSVDLIITDPPYRTTTRGNSGGTSGILKSKDSLSGKMFNNNDIEFSDWLPHLYRVAKEGSHIYIMTNNKNLKDMLISIENSGFNIYKTLIWHKNTAITNMYYMDNHEYIIFARKGLSKKIKNAGTKSVLHFSNPKNKVHPTEKPVDLMELLIRNSSNKYDVILDPFMGSGSTCVAAKNTNRKYIGIELDEDYFKIAKERVNKC